MSEEYPARLSEDSYVVPFIKSIEQEQRYINVCEIFPFVTKEWLDKFEDGWFQDEDDLFPDFFVKFPDGTTTNDVKDAYGKYTQDEIMDSTLHQDVLNNIEAKVDSCVVGMNIGSLKMFKHRGIVIKSIDDDNVIELKQSTLENTKSCRHMTCVIELPTKRIAPPRCRIPSHPLSSSWSGRGIELEGVCYGQSTELRMFIFDNEYSSFTLHPVDSGYQVLIVFDLIVDTCEVTGLHPSPVSNDRMDIFITEVMKPLGVRRLGWFSKQQYIGDKILKNTDARLANLLKSHAKKIEIITLSRMSEYDSWYTNEIIESKTCCHGVYEIGICDGPPKLNTIETFPSPMSGYTKPIEGSSIYSARHSLGDVFVIDTYAQSKHVKTAITETHCDGGDVYTCEFILVNLK